MDKFIKMTTDTTPFVKGMKRVLAEVKRRCEDGMERAILRHFDDVLDKEPRPPYRDGSLEASHSVFVNSRLIKTSADRLKSGLGVATPRRILMQFLHPNVIVGTLVASRKYAASIHEGVSRHGTPYSYRTPGTGKKWIWSKMLRYKSNYIEEISKALR